jgi:hypothetical protein
MAMLSAEFVLNSITAALLVSGCILVWMAIREERPMRGKGR